VDETGGLTKRPDLTEDERRRIMPDYRDDRHPATPTPTAAPRRPYEGSERSPEYPQEVPLETPKTDPKESPKTG
jgi:hypothetical protein